MPYPLTPEGEELSRKLSDAFKDAQELHEATTGRMDAVSYRLCYDLENLIEFVERNFKA